MSAQTLLSFWIAETLVFMCVFRLRVERSRTRDHIELSGVINRHSNINYFALIMGGDEYHYCSSSWTAEWAIARSTRQPGESFSRRVERIMDFKVIPPSTSIQASR